MSQPVTQLFFFGWQIRQSTGLIKNSFPKMEGDDERNPGIGIYTYVLSYKYYITHCSLFFHQLFIFTMNHSNTTTQNQLAKRGRGRPRKIVQEQNLAASTCAGSSSQSSPDLPVNLSITHSSNELDEIALALDYLNRNKRPITTLAYKQPLVQWKVVYFAVLFKSCYKYPSFFFRG